MILCLYPVGKHILFFILWIYLLLGASYREVSRRVWLLDSLLGSLKSIAINWRRLLIGLLTPCELCLSVPFRSLY